MEEALSFIKTIEDNFGMKCKKCGAELRELLRARGISGRHRDFLAKYVCPKCGSYYDENGIGDEEDLVKLGHEVEIPYGRASMVGARTSFLREVLPGWEWDKERWLLISPNKKITIHAHFTEISEDLIPYKDAIMEAMVSIKSVFRSIGAVKFMAGTALEPFKEKAKPYTDVLNRHGLSTS